MHKNYYNYTYKKKKITNITVLSAGTEAYPDRPYSWTLETLQKLGIKNLQHKQQKISQELIQIQDIIICMTHNHQYVLQEKFGIKSFLFNELAFNKKVDLKDDVENTITNSSLEAFMIYTIEKIALGIPNIYKKIIKNKP